jgi:hypothetical protein
VSIPRYTPEQIAELEPGQIFVFGSNAAGHHGGGAARTAHERFGAVWGQGDGLHGRSYAIDTMSGWDALEAAVARFLGFAASHPELTFLVTKIGTGIAGWPIARIASLFADHPANVVLPREFER